MSQSTDPLPTDIATLQALLLQARAERDAVIADRNHLQSQNDRLQHLLRQLQRTQFGRSSEKLDPDQLHLAFEDIEQAIAATEADDDKRDAVRARARAEKRRLNRGSLPAHLPRVHVTIEPDDTNCPCCQAPMHVIGEETSQRLDVIPAPFRVLVTHRPKYACRACEQAVVAPDVLKLPAGTRVCDRERWRLKFIETYSGKKDSNRRTWERAYTALSNLNLIGCEGVFIWLTSDLPAPLDQPDNDPDNDD